jgi:hypothetical protein
MNLVVVFIGRALELADEVVHPTLDDFRLSVLLPTKGDVLTLHRNGSADAVWFKCTGRRFDMTAEDGPTVTLALECF